MKPLAFLREVLSENENFDSVVQTVPTEIGRCVTSGRNRVKYLALTGSEYEVLIDTFKL